MVTLHTTNPYIYKQTNPPLYNKHLYHSSWYLKGTMYKAVASCENCETISGDYTSSMAQVACTMELYPREDILLPQVQIPYN